MERRSINKEVKYKEGAVDKRFFIIIACLMSLLLVNLNAQVTEEWVARYNGLVSSSDKAKAMAVDDAGKVYITGLSGDDYATIKYSQDVGVGEKPKPEYTDYKLQVATLSYNPTGVEISYSNPVSTWITLRLYDVSGREVKTLVSGKVEAGHHQMKLDPGAFPPGVYLVRLEAGTFATTEKLVILR